ncbi:MAG: hypothetical protein HPY66_2161 [Firmicutes bacterium]|nr:hypothetical protein [Bacillota bacterium]
MKKQLQGNFLYFHGIIYAIIILFKFFVCVIANF